MIQTARHKEVNEAVSGKRGGMTEFKIENEKFELKNKQLDDYEQIYS